MANDVLFSATVAGQTYNLNAVDGLILQSYNGLEPVEVNRYGQRTPGQDGETDLGGYQNPRFIALSWVLQEPTVPLLWQARQRMGEIFSYRSATDPITLYAVLPTGLTVAATVQVEGRLDIPFDGREDPFTQRVAVSLKAGDPRLYDPTLRTVALSSLPTLNGWTIYGGASTYGWTIQEEGSSDRGWLLNSGIIVQTLNITYAGGSRAAAPEYPTITLTGPMGSPVITNTTTGEVIDLSANGGLFIPSGDYVIIDLASGPYSSKSPTIRDSAGNSVEQYLSTDSDLFTWHLAPAGELLPSGSYSTGLNAISIDALSSSFVSDVEFAYYDRYKGV